MGTYLINYLCNDFNWSSHLIQLLQFNLECRLFSNIDWTNWHFAVTNWQLPFEHVLREFRELLQRNFFVACLSLADARVPECCPGHDGWIAARLRPWRCFFCPFWTCWRLWSWWRWSPFHTWSYRCGLLSSRCPFHTRCHSWFLLLCWYLFGTRWCWCDVSRRWCGGGRCWWCHGAFLWATRLSVLVEDLIEASAWSIWVRGISRCRVLLVLQLLTNHLWQVSAGKTVYLQQD